MFFNEEGILNIDEIVVNHASFKNIMEDGVVTEEEIKAQSDKVVAMLHAIEAKYCKKQVAEIKELLVESSVLYTVYNIYSIQNINR
jgi:predicted nucleic acid-binding protein